MRSCLNCNHSIFPEPDDKVSMICRRFPPVRLSATQTSFAITRRDWRCGEHRYSLIKLFKRQPAATLVKPVSAPLIVS